MRPEHQSFYIRQKYLPRDTGFIAPAEYWTRERACIRSEGGNWFEIREPTLQSQHCSYFFYRASAPRWYREENAGRAEGGTPDRVPVILVASFRSGASLSSSRVTAIPNIDFAIEARVYRYEDIFPEAAAAQRVYAVMDDYYLEPSPCYRIVQTFAGWMIECASGDPVSPYLKRFTFLDPKAVRDCFNNGLIGDEEIQLAIKDGWWPTHEVTPTLLMLLPVQEDGKTQPAYSAREWRCRVSPEKTNVFVVNGEWRQRSGFERWDYLPTPPRFWDSFLQWEPLGWCLSDCDYTSDVTVEDIADRLTARSAMGCPAEYVLRDFDSCRGTSILRDNGGRIKSERLSDGVLRVFSERLQSSGRRQAIADVDGKDVVWFAPLGGTEGDTVVYVQGFSHAYLRAAHQTRGENNAVG